MDKTIKNNKQDSNKDIRRLAWCSLGIGAAFAVIVLTIALRVSDSTIQGLNEVIPNVLWYSLLLVLCIVVPAIIAFMLIVFFDSDVIKTLFHLTAKKCSARWLKKNSIQISKCLRPFMYELLLRHNDMLQFKLGQNISCLNECGYNARNGCVFYRFSLITTKPQYEDRQLQHIIQGFICSELNDYGIFGLSPTYKSITAQCYSVYLDRCFYDESNSNLVFDLLYICTEQSASYFNKAVARDTDTLKAEQTVFDDEII